MGMSINEIMRKQIDPYFYEYVYMKRVQEHSPSQCAEFSQRVLLVHAEKNGKFGSTISFYNKSGRWEKLDTDKPIQYWKTEYLDREVQVNGTLVTEQDKKELIVLNAYMVQENEKALNIPKDVLSQIEDRMGDFSPEQKMAVYDILARVGDYRDEEDSSSDKKIPYFDQRKLDTFYQIIKPWVPERIREEIDICKEEAKRETSSSIRRNIEKTKRFLVTMDWYGNDEDDDIDKIKSSLDKNIIGKQEAKEKLIQEAKWVKYSTEKKPRNLLLVGLSRKETQDMAIAFLEGTGRKYATFELRSVNDAISLNGSSRGYENAIIGSLTNCIHRIGVNGALLLPDTDLVSTKKEISAVMETFAERQFEDALLEVPLDISQMYVIFTAQKLEDVPTWVSGNSEIIYVYENTFEEKVEVVNSILVPKICKELKMAQTFSLPLDICKELVMEKEDLERVECELRHIYLEVLESGEAIDTIIEKNKKKVQTMQYIHADDFAAYIKKFESCHHLYSESAKKRIKTLIDMGLYVERDKDYALSALDVYVNIVKQPMKLLDVDELRYALDASHYKMTGVKEFVIKAVASRMLQKEDKKAPLVIVLNGPAGVGKTSLAKVIAKALGRAYVEISLNGVASASYLKGTPRRLNGGQPGALAYKMSREGVGTDSALILFDEADKMIANALDNPYTALYDILDEYGEYEDVYLEGKVSTKDTIFVLTTNDKNKLAQPLLDRCEVIDLEGYSRKEKEYIARDYILPRMLEKYQMETIEISDETLKYFMLNYCMDVGVRDVQRALDNVIQTIALREKMKLPKQVVITKQDLEEALGGRKMSIDDLPEKSDSMCGQVCALAVAGENLGVAFGIQVAKSMEGHDLTTGLVKGSFAEAVEDAKTLVGNMLGCSLPKLHIRAMAPGIEKDGPSAGVAVFTAIMSMMKNKAAPLDIAMTGTIGLNGYVGKVGGLTQKIDAADRAGMKKVYVPEENYQQLVREDGLSKFDIEICPIRHVNVIMKDVFGEV